MHNKLKTNAEGKHKFLNQNLFLRTINIKPAMVAGFAIKEGIRGQNGAKTLYLNMRYKEAEIYPVDPQVKDLRHKLSKGEITQEEYVAGKAAIWQQALSVNKWYVRYSYRNPGTGKFERIKVYEDVNRFKGEDKIKYSILLRDAINLQLEQGYNPFAGEIEVKEVISEYKQVLASVPSDRSKYTVMQAFKYFLDKTKDSGASKATNDRYRSHINLFKHWLNARKMLLTPAAAITADHVMAFMKEYSEMVLPKSKEWPKGKIKWNNKTYNNYLGSFQSCFNFLSKSIHGVIPRNPIEGAETKITISKKHTAYSDKQLQRLLAVVREKKDTFMEGIILTVYYACIRSKEELRSFRVGNILFDRDLIRLDAEGTKGRRDDHIPLDPELKKYYLELDLDKLPADWYIFSNTRQPGPKQAWANMYAETFRPYRDQLQLTDDHTIYGLKHTRVIHLVLSKKSPYAIMQLTRHTTLDQLMAYLRDLGLTINYEAVEDSRKL